MLIWHCIGLEGHLKALLQTDKSERQAWYNIKHGVKIIKRAKINLTSHNSQSESYMTRKMNEIGLSDVLKNKPNSPNSADSTVSNKNLRDIWAGSQFSASLLSNTTERQLFSIDKLCANVDSIQYPSIYFIFMMRFIMSLKLATNIHRVIGHCWKCFQGQRSKVKVTIKIFF